MSSNIQKDPKIKTATDLQNLIIWVKNESEKSDFKVKSAIDSCCDLLSEVIAESENEKSIKLSFISEQLRLINLDSTKQRRYSPELLSSCAMWQNTSPAAYRLLLNEDILCLPSVGQLKRLSSAMTVHSGLSSSAIAYIEARTR